MFVNTKNNALFVLDALDLSNNLLPHYHLANPYCTEMSLNIHSFIHSYYVECSIV